MCCCKGFWKKILPFMIALNLGILAVGLMQKNVNNSVKQISFEESQLRTSNSLSGSGVSSGGVNETSSNAEVSSLRILSKPRPAYTDEARDNLAQGTVRLRVTFLANGEIGSVSVVKGLSYGLDEQAIAAAKAIKFVPATMNGKSVTVTKIVEYSFSIY